MRFYPANFKNDASALYVDAIPSTSGGERDISVKIKVYVYSPITVKQPESNEESCISHEELRTDSLSKSTSPIASFPSIITHGQLQELKADDSITVKVVMEYVHV